jgi:3-methyladenine DNA glycosylase AlkD
MNALKTLEEQLDELANPDIAAHSARFFKSGPGEYGEGDRFLGIRVPVLRKLAARFRKLPLSDIQHLLGSPLHEKRLLGALMLVECYNRGDGNEKDRIYALYMEQIGRAINNWDLIDTTCPHIVGAHLANRDRSALYALAASENLWQRRAAILACFFFIRNKEFDDALAICEILVNDQHDLIHKGCGWMLREIGKRDQGIEEQFLQQYSASMPRTMLRYAIEHFDQDKRSYYMEQKKRTAQ